MLRYFLAAQALRAFSTTSASKRLYRNIGNVLGARKRAKGLPAHYLSRADANLRRLEEAKLVYDGARVMEIGTGWAHWEALFVRCFYEVEAVLMDVWDNRQFAALKSFAAEFKLRLHELGRPADQVERAEAVLDQVTKSSSFDDLYRRLGFRYVLGVDEAYRSVGDSELDLIFSSDVLEHVPRSQVAGMLHEHFRILRSGGACHHQVVPADHLCIYDRAVHAKNYLRYSERTWNWWFANDVQYVNLLQMSEWREAYERAGFEVTCTPTDTVDIDGLSIAPRFRSLPPEDLGVAVFSLLARKPAS